MAQENHTDEEREEEGTDSGERLLEDAEPPLAELPLSSIVVDPRWNCRRGAYTEEEIQEAVERYSNQPMLHPPSVAPIAGDGRYQLVTGFLRFEVMRRQGWEVGWFRIVRGSEMDLYLWNLAENTARRALTGHELVERVWMLHSRGASKDRLTQACGFGIRYLNRLLFIRRRAHPELYELFRLGHPKLTVGRMARLVGHEPHRQMEEFRRSEEHRERAVEIEQGFSEEPLEEEEEKKPAGYRVREPKGQRSRRRRLPSRAHVRSLLDIYERASNLNPEYRRGAVAVFRHLLTGEPLPEPITDLRDEGAKPKE